MIYKNERMMTSTSKNFFRLLPFFAILSFSTWFFKIQDIQNILIYGTITILLIIFKANSFVLIFFAMFARMANFESSTKTYAIIIAVITGYLFIKEIILKLNKNQFNFNMKLFPSILFIVIYFFISLFWTENKIDAIKEIPIIFIGYLYYFIFMNENKKISFFEISKGVSFILLVLSMEYFILILRSGIFMPSNDKSVVHNFWNNPNGIAIFYALLFPVSLYKYFSHEKIKLKLFFIIIDLLAFYILIYLSGRSAFFGIIIALLFLPIIFSRKFKKNIFLVLLFVIIIFMTIILAIILFKNYDLNLFNKINKFSTWRLSIYEIIINQIDSISVFLFGRGKSGTRLIIQKNNLVPFPHNFVLSYLAFFGIIGVILVFLNIRNIFEILIYDKTLFSKIVIFSIISYIMGSLIDELYEKSFIAIYYYFLIAIVERNKNINDMEFFYLKGENI